MEAVTLHESAQSGSNPAGLPPIQVPGVSVSSVVCALRRASVPFGIAIVAMVSDVSRCIARLLLALSCSSTALLAYVLMCNKNPRGGSGEAGGDVYSIRQRSDRS